MTPGRVSPLLGCLLTAVLALAADLVPRMTFWTGDSQRMATWFQHMGVLNYDTFLLSEDGETLYVGARDTLLALGLDSAHSLKLKGEIPWRPSPSKKHECVFKKKSNETECFNFIRVLVQLNKTHLYTCGTYAFSPTCAYVELKNFTLVKDAREEPLLLDGKGMCPFDPQHQNTAIIVGGELYTATMNNFQGNEPIISRTLGNRSVLKTDAFLNWLHADAAFVASFNPSPPDDEKVYFFFAETAKEFDFFDKLTVSRVARVCKNDVGGDKVLQKKWTTFLKAQLSCTQPGQFPHTVIQHVFALPQQEEGAVFYGVFTSQWQAGHFASSAVCAFSLGAIKKAFDGKYKEFNKDCSQWMTYNGPMLDPRPGSCSVGPSSDKALTFMKEHFLMDEKILPTYNRPLLVNRHVTYTRIAVHQIRGVSGRHYSVMFLGTDQGFLQKAVVVRSGAHIIEAVQLFKKAEPVRNLLLSSGKGTLYVGYSEGVLQIPLANCSVYQSCADCVLARDPYCAWDRRSHKCRDVRDASEDAGDWLQDIENGSPDARCPRGTGRARASPRTSNDSDGSVVTTLNPPLNSVVRLPCPQGSALANYTWDFPERKRPEGLLVQEDQALVVIVQRDTLGTYECWAHENGFPQLVARYHLLSPDFPDPLGGFGAPEDPRQHAGREGEQPTYWVQFVTMTVLLSMTLAGAAGLAFFSYHEKLQERSKVQGCSTPEASGAAGQEKVPLNGSQSPAPGSEGQLQGPPQEAPASSKSCCVQLEGGFQAIDADNNRLSSGVPNGEEPRAAVAVEGI
ncbi:semaphorin-4A [Hemicordylus capensis]|uniref:semaphorin-4A n=1 Tax=Hemicordylus capensis TaxID=884348 RepID=UPI002304788D|nr:semaphorin-4A [Hemicordylus capensis]XP_053134436.1 semaphorin-4A [Hemicordylus capensis]XP_053134437.1 semaphorin-4A [Hemicordylus capensis]XP_053134438.1 semaphorin-4A [Hemicordylus capensis]XP_053134439.1 semaphorin-4A [Hemicordylus capensis]XP_053134440.1 semaphorin-4A [Hemicordylus capensis]XP_053134441.1 semaphorin-4A [Hemicordylus capensis]XP_053134442.1 semaphorin-4A [Hemicordylus capensis]XP_053134443.1 semaphorin-4A [Hemicordylus capensis]XP_053134444.1 semaphorin-4A [Hemicord